MLSIDIDIVLRAFRRSLPDGSATAKAIDARAPLAEISECAEQEGVHQLAAILFEAQQEELSQAAAMPADLARVMRERMQSLRADIPDSSKTAQAIDREAPWEEISACAEQEGLHEIAAVLFEAQQEQLRAETR
jgi:hypothetical protein